MPDPDPPNVTALLARVRGGDLQAKGVLLDLTYSELRALAGHLFRGQSANHTLQPTALVNELCLKLLGSDSSNWEDRKHFFSVAAKAMRNLLTDHARARNAERRGGDHVTIALGSADVPAPPSAGIDLIVLDETLTRLADLDPRLAQIFELRFLVGLSVDRAADIIGCSPRTVESDTRFIRAWLQKELSS